MYVDLTHGLRRVPITRLHRLYHWSITKISFAHLFRRALIVFNLFYSSPCLFITLRPFLCIYYLILLMRIIPAAIAATVASGYPTSHLHLHCILSITLTCIYLYEWVWFVCFISEVHKSEHVVWTYFVNFV